MSVRRLRALLSRAAAYGHVTMLHDRRTTERILAAEGTPGTIKGPFPTLHACPARLKLLAHRHLELNTGSLLLMVHFTESLRKQNATCDHADDSL